MGGCQVFAIQLFWVVVRIVMYSKLPRYGYVQCKSMGILLQFYYLPGGLKATLFEVSTL